MKDMLIRIMNDNRNGIMRFGNDSKKNSII